MSKGILGTFIDCFFNDDCKGTYGEVLTEWELKLVQLFGRKGKVLRNVYLLKDNGETSEIDVIFITQKGIFVFESKNYSGWIFGDERNRSWTATLPNGEKNQFYNPIMQNRTHIKWLRKYVGDEIPLYSIIVFSNRCELKKITVFSDDVSVIKRDWTYVTVKKYWDRMPDCVSDSTIEMLYVRLKDFTDVDPAVKAAHVQNIENKYKQPKTQLKVQPKTQDVFRTVDPIAELMKKYDMMNLNMKVGNNTSTQELLCPQCGRKLILRTAAKGSNAGKQFYGCSGFPHCRYIRNI